MSNQHDFISKHTNDPSSLTIRYKLFLMLTASNGNSPRGYTILIIHKFENSKSRFAHGVWVLVA